MSSSIKASFATTLFTLAALFGLFFHAPIDSILVPHLFLYIVLLINTFLSVRFYSPIQPKNISQTLIDGVLVITYIAVALSFGRPLVFAVSALALFVAAPLKYVLMRGLIPYEALLRRKTAIDLTGTIACAALLLGTIMGYPLASAWAFAIIFALMNIYHLLIWPMYKL